MNITASKQNTLTANELALMIEESDLQLTVNGINLGILTKKKPRLDKHAEISMTRYKRKIPPSKLFNEMPLNSYVALNHTPNSTSEEFKQFYYKKV